MSAASTLPATAAPSDKTTVVHVTVPLTGNNAPIVEATMPSIVHALEATRARVMDGGQDGLRVRFNVTLGHGAVATVVQHPNARAAKPMPRAARTRVMDEIAWWLTRVEQEFLRVARDCSGASGQLQDTSGSTALVTHAVKHMLRIQCADMMRHVSALRDHLLFTRTYLSTDEAAVAAQAMVYAAAVHPDDVPEPHNFATIRADAHRGITWTGNPVNDELLMDNKKQLKLDSNVWRAFIPEVMHGAAHFAHAASHRDMPTPILTKQQRENVLANDVDDVNMRLLARDFSGFDMLLVQLSTPWTVSEVPLRTTEEVFAFGRCAAQYMMRMLRYPTSSENTATSSVAAVRAWASRDASRVSLLPEGVAPPAVVHWNIVPSDAPWTAAAARDFARTLNAAARSEGYPDGTAPAVAVFFPTAPGPSHALLSALKQFAPLVMYETPPLVADEDQDHSATEQREARVESKAAASSDVDEPTPLEVAFCSVAAIPDVSRQ